MKNTAYHKTKMLTDQVLEEVNMVKDAILEALHAEDKENEEPAHAANSMTGAKIQGMLILVKEMQGEMKAMVAQLKSKKSKMGNKEPTRGKILLELRILLT